MQSNRLVSLEKIAVRLRDKIVLSNISWNIDRCEQWAVVGPNGSGKSTLAMAILGRVPVVRGEVTYGLSQAEGTNWRESISRIGYVCPDEYRDLIQRNILEDSFRHFSGKVGDFTPAEAVLFEGFEQEKEEWRHPQRILEVARRMGIENLLARPVVALSVGESRKLLIARALLREPRLLILDKPFDGLDRDSRRSLESIIKELINEGIAILLITNRTEEIIQPITHVMVMQNGGIFASGQKEDILGKEILQDSHPGQVEIDETIYSRILEICEQMRSETQEKTPLFSETLVEMRNIMVKYDGVVVVDNLNWTIKRGESWAILGPNGAGKSTLLKLILGDNQQAYANEIMLFGQKKGSGATIWDLKKHIGVVSSDLQARYRAETKVLDVVCSGFFDSVGLYRHCGESERELGNLWLRLTGLETLAEKRFDQLSYGQRQLALVARAMIKNPWLLILDEPCDGLDFWNRAKLLKLIEFIGKNTTSTIVITTHREDEIPDCVQNVLLLRKGKGVATCRRTLESVSKAMNSEMRAVG